jgi:two-component system chemotaxis response regulator CheY
VATKILVVDDDDLAREGLCEALARRGHHCRAAADGTEAWELHRAERADVILSDWRMPRLDGVELCKRVRATDAGGAYTYFVLMSAFGDKEHFLRGMAAGADDYLHKPVDLDELEARLASAERVLTLYACLAEKNRTLRKDSQRLFVQARIDALTGVANRLRMTEDLGAIFSRGARYGERYSAALCDIDWFKAYNDAFGHVAGDQVLKRVADAIRVELRRGDSVYRYGGEEFLVVLPEQTSLEAYGAMERVRRHVERIAIPTTEGRFVTISIGIAELLPEDVSVEAWLERTDRALYVAKGMGRNRVETSQPLSRAHAG